MTEPDVRSDLPHIVSDGINTWGGNSAAPQQKPLFTTRRPTWQWMMWRVIGWSIVATGMISALVYLASGGPHPWLNAAFSVFFFCGTGALCLLLSAALHHSRIDGFDQHLEVRVGLGKPRPVTATQISQLQREVSRRNGITWVSIVGRNDRKKKLFRAFRINVGYEDLLSWLESRCPAAWSAYAETVEKMAR